jgi:hypothetical protein
MEYHAEAVNQATQRERTRAMLLIVSILALFGVVRLRKRAAVAAVVRARGKESGA